MNRPDQYFMYGIAVPYNWYKGWEAGTGRKFPAGIYGDVFCLFDGRDGKYLIVGKILESNFPDKEYMGEKEPLVVPELSESDKFIIQASIKEKFDLKGEFHYYFITQ